MVEPTHPRQSYQCAMTRFPSLYGPHLGRVLPQSIMDPIRMIVAEVFTNQPPQVGFIEHDHVIQQFSVVTPHPPFSNPILPGALIGCPDHFATHGLEHLCGFSLVLPVSIEDQVTRCSVFGEGLSQLLHDPTAARMLSGVEV
jgi:hypothetical protein